jgi:hypothetical protein
MQRGALQIHPRKLKWHPSNIYSYQIMIASDFASLEGANQASIYSYQLMIQS